MRSLPQEEPPATFRATVYARIAALEKAASRNVKGAAAIVALSRADTLPELPTLASDALPLSARMGNAISGPIVRLPLSTSNGLERERRRRLTLGPAVRVAIGVAAMFVLAVMLTQFMRGVFSFGSIATGILSGVSSHTQTPSDVQHYLPDAHYSLVTAALASTGWLVYSAVDTSGEAMLFGEARQTQQSAALLSKPVRDGITLYALTTHWVIWSAGRAANAFLAGQSAGSATPWALYATFLPVAGSLTDLSTPARARLTHTLIARTTAGATLDGVWADDTMVLVAGAQSNGQSKLERFTLGANAITSSAIVRQARSGHRVMEPSADEGVIYWADVWADASHALHSTVWRQGADGQAQEILGSTDAFYPVATHGVLVWVSAQSPVFASLATFAYAAGATFPLFDGLNDLGALDPTATAVATTDTLATLTGALQAYRLSARSQWVVAQNVSAHSLQAAGNMVLWRSNGRARTYDLRSHAPSAVENQMDNAPITSVTSTAITWATNASGPIYVYNLPAAA